MKCKVSLANINYTICGVQYPKKKKKKNFKIMTKNKKVHIMQND